MNVLITNQNIEFFRSIKKNLVIVPSTENTSIIKCTEKTFKKIHSVILMNGHNPYALMYW